MPSDLNWEQQIRLTAVEMATSYYSQKMRLLRGMTDISDTNGEDAAMGFAKRIAKYIRDGT